ncbi:MAG: hypothetical protein ABEJ28_11875 [Salinigranum sp.]
MHDFVLESVSFVFTAYLTVVSVRAYLRVRARPFVFSSFGFGLLTLMIVFEISESAKLLAPGNDVVEILEAVGFGLLYLSIKYQIE